jgi:hypothetical protein
MTTSPSQDGRRQLKTFVVSASILDLWLSGRSPNVGSDEVLVFEAGLELREVRSYFFGWRNSLKSICIPASVEFIRKQAFSDQPGNLVSGLETLTPMY